VALGGDAGQHPAISAIGRGKRAEDFDVLGQTPARVAVGS
jgi:hypothetical protein